jgi:hypothetical protein
MKFCLEKDPPAGDLFFAAGAGTIPDRVVIDRGLRSNCA